MNKSLRVLIAVVVLAFAAAGLYYAWFAPAKPALEKIDLQKQAGPKVAIDQGKPLEDVGRPSTAAPAPVSVPSTVPATATPPEAAFTATPPSNIPPGFKVDDRPMQPLPSTLPGFVPAQTTGAAPNGTTAPASGASTPPTGAGSAKNSGTAPNPSTIAPVPNSNPVVPSPSNPGAKSQGIPATTPGAPPAGVTPVPASKTPATKSPSTGETIHVVVEGDTLSSIARKYWDTAQGWENIVKANPGVNPNALKLGTKLVIPAKDGAAGPATKNAPSAPAATHTGKVTDYEVISGDTLSKISNKVYGDSKFWKLIYEANRKTIGNDPAALTEGMKLTIPPKPDGATKPSTPTTPPTKPS
ncbi:MAG: LysM peptidoglycan-binding domain-containing protein [Planctomycetes bacterium]|nr:LysM peptidoglycan-binding domain-containing protein [Planctomycetota bacterium]